MYEGVSVMLWDALNYGFRSHVLVINGTLTVQGYVEEIL